MNSYLTASISIAAFFLGQSLVTRRRWTGFLVWAMSNYFVAATRVLQADQATACMFFVYFAANVHSMLAWYRHPRRLDEAGDRADRKAGIRRIPMADSRQNLWQP